MNGPAGKLLTILERFGLREPVPDDVQAYILANKRSAAMAVLRHHNDYSVAFGAALAFFHWARRAGFRPSMRQSKAAAAAIALFLCALTLTIFVIIFYHPKSAESVNKIDDEGRIEIIDPVTPRREQDKKSAIEKEEKKPGDAVPAVKDRFRLGVETFTSDAVGAGEARRITDMIAAELIRLKGPEKVVRLGAADRRKSANLALLGGIEKLGDTFFLTAKIVNAETGRVMSSFSESASSEDEVKAACGRIAARAAGKVE